MVSRRRGRAHRPKSHVVGYAFAANPPGSIKRVGFGFNISPEIAQALQDNAIHGWIAQLPSDIGRRAVQAAASLLKGETVPDAIHTDFLVITKDNLKDPKVQGLLPK